MAILGEPIILGGGSGIPVEIIVETSPEASVLCINGTTVLSKTANAEGKAAFEIKKEGLWTIQASLDGETVETEVLIEHNISEDLSFVDPILANNTWEKISAVARAGKASEFWNIGDTKTFTCGSYTMTAQIIGFDHDDVTDSTSYGRTKAGITFQTVECYPTTYAWSSSNVPWKTSTTRVTNLPAILNTMTDVKDYIVPVNKEATKTIDKTGIEIVSDNLFLLSMRELTTSGYIENPAGTQYAYYAAGNSMIKYSLGSSSAKAWWTRSDKDIVDSGTNGRVAVTIYGTVSDYGYAVTNKYSYAFGFCL